MENFANNITIDFVSNMRDLGGYLRNDGYRVARKRIYRSGELRHKTASDVTQLKQITGINTVLDLRGKPEIDQSSVALLSQNGIKYFNIPLESREGGPTPDSENILFNRFSNMGEFYLSLMRQDIFAKRLVDALEVIGNPHNLPVLFHCAVGKDRTGILSATVLSILGVADKDIVMDYNLTESYMAEFKKRLKDTPRGVRMLENLPDYVWEARSDSMISVLSEIRRQYGSMREYLQSFGIHPLLFAQLERSLVERTV
jgi:protein-tyrosine phosphatase